MAGNCDLNFDEVVKFLRDKGGMVTNLELVSHFRKSLNDPQTKVEMRLCFKDIINSIANVSEDQGTKCISLKPQYLNASMPQYLQQEFQSGQAHRTKSSDTYQPYWRYRLSSNASMIPPPPVRSHRSSSMEHTVSSIPQQNSQGFNDCNKRRGGYFDAVCLDREESSHSSFSSNYDNDPHIYPVLEHSTFCNNNNCDDDMFVQNVNSHHPASFGPKDIDRHSDILSAVNEDNASKQDTLSTGDESEEAYRVQSGSVKERAQQIEKMAALEQSTSKRSTSPHVYKHSKGKENKHEKISDDDTSVVSTLDPKLRRQWFVKSAQADYHGLLALLKAEPRLAGLRDPTSGYTALHWASKHGNADIVKLIAGSHQINPDLKSNGGYTCIHLATLYRHKPIVELLVKTYGANPAIRDNSGKRADQYPTNFLKSSGVPTRLSNSKSINLPINHKILRVRRPEAATFIRIGSLNLKVSSKGRRVQRLKTWGSADSVAETWSSASNDRISFRRKKKKKNSNFSEGL